MAIVEEEASSTGTTVGTVGQLSLFPGGINIIPGRVELSVDLRDIDEEVRDRTEQRTVKAAYRLCEERGINLEIETLQRMAPTHCSELVQDASRNACEKLGLEPYTLSSGAGHDGIHLAKLCPVGMIFVRSKDGTSHNPAENSSQEDCADAANVLYHTVLNLAGHR